MYAKHVNLVSLDEGKKEIRAEIVPNPSHGVFQLYIADEPCRNINVRDVMGSVILNEQIQLKHSSYELNLSGYSKGVYFVELVGEKSSQVKKIVIE